jgi:hypothetical protein
MSHPTPTFAELATLEPRLDDLLAEAKAHHADAGPTFCSNEVWYRPGGLKPRLSKLVGWNSGQTGLLGSSAAYDLAYTEVYRALPDCGPDCVCQRIWRNA